MRLPALVLLVLLPLVLSARQSGAPTPNRTERFAAKDLDASEQAIATKSRAAKPPTAAVELLNVPSHRISMRHRSGTAAAEQHPDLTDVFVIKSGSALLQLGGEITDPTGSNGELRGPAIKGGETFPIGAGDVVNVPPTVAHQMLLKDGETITFFTIKVKEPASH